MAIKTVTELPSIIQANKALERRRAIPQIIAVMVKNVLLLSYGMTLGFPSMLIASLSKPSPGETMVLHKEEISWIGSINLMCVPIGCLLSGVVTQPIGRRRSMQCGSVPIIICWLIFYFCDDLWQIYLALAIIGLSGGLLEAPVLTYVAEITEPRLRGVLSSTSAFAVILGVLCELLLGSFLHWRSLALYSCISPIASLILLFFIPESPHWYIMKNKMDDARKSLAWLRGWTTVSEIEEEFQLLAAEEKEKDANDNSFFKSSLALYTKRRFLNPLALVSFVFFLGHFTGMTTLLTYAVLIFSALKVPIDSYYATVLLGVAQFIGSILCVILIRLMGKRGLTLWSLAVCAFSFITVATYAFFIGADYINPHEDSRTTTFESASQWIPLIFLSLAALVTAGGIRVLPWILIGEVFSRETRAIGSGVAGAVAYVFAFISNKVFLDAISEFTLPGTYWFYGIVGVVGLIVMYFWLPETEGKELHEISDHFAGKTDIGNNIKRVSSSKMNGNVNEAFDDSVLESSGKHDYQSRL